MLLKDIPLADEVVWYDHVFEYDKNRKAWRVRNAVTGDEKTFVDEVHEFMKREKAPEAPEFKNGGAHRMTLSDKARKAGKMQAQSLLIKSAKTQEWGRRQEYSKRAMSHLTKFQPCSNEVDLFTRDEWDKLSPEELADRIMLIDKDIPGSESNPIFCTMRESFLDQLTNDANIVYNIRKPAFYKLLIRPFPVLVPTRQASRLKSQLESADPPNVLEFGVDKKFSVQKLHSMDLGISEIVTKSVKRGRGRRKSVTRREFKDYKPTDIKVVNIEAYAYL